MSHPIVRGLTPADVAASDEAGWRAFLAGPPSPDADRPVFDPAQGVGAFDAEGRMLAQSWWWRFRQVWGGRAVPCAGVARVTVEPAARGSGLARRVVCRVLDDARAQGFPVAALYPTVPGLYRDLGFALAGDHRPVRVAAADLARLPAAEGVAVRRADQGEDRGVVERLHAEALTGGGVDGWLDRSEFRWEWQWWVWSSPAHEVYVAERAGAPVGYVVLHRDDADGDTSLFRLEVADMVAPDRDVLLALWGLVAAHRSVVADVDYVAPVPDPLPRLLDVRAVQPRPVFVDRFMLRLLDVPAALAQRGYRDGIAGAVVVRVVDDVMPDVGGTWRLAVADGRAEVVAVDTPPDVTLDMVAASGAYSGATPATVAARLGRASGDPGALALLDTLFASPGAWCPDFF